MAIAQRVLVLVGTRKSAFILSAAPDRRRWQIGGPFFPGWSVHHLTLDDRAQPRLFAALNSEVWGSYISRSDDLGGTWSERSPGLGFSADDDRKLTAVWHVEPGHPSRPDEVWAGVAPAALFTSGDGGHSWELVSGLDGQPTRKEWEPGGGGLALHTIVADHADPQRLFVAVSAGGVYRSDDSGRTWQPKNRGTAATFKPDPWPAAGQCVHKMVQSPVHPDWLFQQNHCGVYRSRDAGDSWEPVQAGLPATEKNPTTPPEVFGFPMARHPREPETIYIVPLQNDESRFTPGGRFCVYRSRDGGQRWEAMPPGLPQEHAYLCTFREALATDRLDPAGVYVGTTGGHLFASRDEGDSWQTLAVTLPPILSVSTGVLEG